MIDGGILVSVEAIIVNVAVLFILLLLLWADYRYRGKSFTGIGREDDAHRGNLVLIGGDNDGL